MKILNNQELHQLFAPVWCHEKIYITQDFGNPSTRYQTGFHTGVDIRNYNWLLGDDTFAPIDGEVIEVSKSTLTGWTTVIESILGEVRFTAEILHTRKPNVLKGDRVMKGEFIAKSGIILTPNQWWTAPHTHLEFIAWYEAEEGGWKPNYENGFAGRIHPIEVIDGITDIAELEGKDVKTMSSSDVYNIRDGMRYKYADEVSYSAQGRVFARDLLVISDHTMSRMSVGGVSKIDYDKNEALITKQLLGLLEHNPNRAKELKEKHYE